MSVSINSIPLECSIVLVIFRVVFDSPSESEDEFDDEEVEDFRFLFDFFFASFFDFLTAFLGDLDRDGFETERDLRTSCLTIRFWAGETCFEDFDGFDSFDRDLPFLTDSDFLRFLRSRASMTYFST